MKKFLALIAIFFLSFCLLSCGNNQPSEEGNDDQLLEKITVENQEFAYDGQNHTLTITNLPEGYEALAVGSVNYKEPGTYTIKYEIYKIGKATPIKTVEGTLIILPPDTTEADLAKMELKDQTVEYDEEEHTIEVTNLIEGYVAIPVGEVNFTEIGEHQITYQIKKAYQDEVLKTLTANLTINVTWTNYVSLAAELSVYYDGGQKTINPINRFALPLGYKLKADGTVKYTEIGDYDIVYNIVTDDENEEVVYQLKGVLHIVELVTHDYAAAVSFDTLLRPGLEVTVKTFIDGDTTHFNVPDSVVEGGVLKARYIAINTPESTGSIEPYGKTASNFTKEKLSNAYKIYIEPDGANWEADSTGSRYLTWVWYKPDANSEWRNLNIEILQNGLALASNTAQNTYGDTAQKALDQAKSLKLYLYSGEKDPTFYYGAGIKTTLKDISLYTEEFSGKKVIFEATVYKYHDNGVYVVDYDEETGQNYGMYVYHGNSAAGGLIGILTPGNRIYFVGTVSEFNGTWQVSGLSYRLMKPNAEDSTHLLEEVDLPDYITVTASDFVNKTLDISRLVYIEDIDDVDEETKTFNYADILMNTPVKMENLEVVDARTTTNEASSSYGAMTLICKSGNITINIRTEVLKDEAGELITSDYFLNKTISIQGIVDKYEGSYQIRVYRLIDITINE